MNGDIVSPIAPVLPAPLEALADALMQAGVISGHERMTLLNNAENDSARHRAADQGRYRDVACAHAFQPITNEKAIMNPKQIMSAIEKNRAVMGAQIEKFAALSPKPPKSDSINSTVTVASLLQDAMLGHLQGAAESLQALAEVEAIDQRRDEAGNGHSEAMVIDSVASVVRTENMK